MIAFPQQQTPHRKSGMHLIVTRQQSAVKQFLYLEQLLLHRFRLLFISLTRQLSAAGWFTSEGRINGEIWRRNNCSQRQHRVQ
jgi:hypothetical protein